MSGCWINSQIESGNLRQLIEELPPNVSEIVVFWWVFSGGA